MLKQDLSLFVITAANCVGFVNKTKLVCELRGEKAAKIVAWNLTSYLKSTTK
jgi:hypothetical protein